jgi:hypothetical protein
MTCTSVRVVAGSASVLLAVPIMLGHDGSLRDTGLGIFALGGDLLDCLSGGYMTFVDAMTGLGGTDDGLVASSKSTVLTRRKVLSSEEERAANTGRSLGCVITLFAFFFRELLSGASGLCCFGFANSVRRSRFDVDRTEAYHRKEGAEFSTVKVVGWPLAFSGTRLGVCNESRAGFA